MPSPGTEDRPGEGVGLEGDDGEVRGGEDARRAMLERGCEAPHAREEVEDEEARANLGSLGARVRGRLLRRRERRRAEGDWDLPAGVGGCPDEEELSLLPGLL